MADFKTAFAFVLQHEDPSVSGKVTMDAGGRTRFGIAARFHPELTEDFFTGPAEDALVEAERIVRREYWDQMRLAEVENQNVANKLFDMAVNMGVRQGGVYAQRAVSALGQRVTEDGVMGAETLAAVNAVNAMNAMEYYQLLCELSVAHYRHIAMVNPEQAANLKGWLKRAEA